MYNWGISDLEKRLKILEDKKENIISGKYSYQKLDTIISIIGELRGEIIEEKFRKKINNSKFSKRLFDAYYDYEKYTLERYDLGILITELDSLLDILNLPELPTENFVFPDSKISEKKLIHDVSLFYKDFDDEIYSYFCQLFRNKQINFSYSNNMDTIHNGECIFIPILNENFIRICDISIFDNIANCTHEFGHSIANLINPLDFFYGKMSILGEVEAMTPELIASDYFSKINDDYEKYFAMLDYRRLFYFASQATNIILNGLFAKYWIDNNMCNSFYTLCKYCYKKKLSPKTVINAIKCNYPSPYTYVISYLTSIELYFLYKTDKEKALAVYKNIIKENEVNHYKDILGNQIILGDHVQEYALELMLKTNIVDKNTVSI